MAPTDYSEYAYPPLQKQQAISAQGPHDQQISISDSVQQREKTRAQQVRIIAMGEVVAQHGRGGRTLKDRGSVTQIYWVLDSGSVKLFLPRTSNVALKRSTIYTVHNGHLVGPSPIRGACPKNTTH